MKPRLSPMRIRDLVVGVVAAGLVAYPVVLWLYRWFPPLTGWTGAGLLAVAVAEGALAFRVRSRIAAGRIGVGAGRLHPLAVARAVTIAMASAWAGAVALGWWLGVLVFLLTRRGDWRVARLDTPGAVIAAACALALVVAALALQHCCRSPDDPGDDSAAGRG